MIVIEIFILWFFEVRDQDMVWKWLDPSQNNHPVFPFVLQAV